MAIDWSDSLRAIRATMERNLATLGFDTSAHITTEFESDAQRYEVWCLESLHWTAGRLLAGRPEEALRGLLQAATYSGRLGGAWPLRSGDTYLTLRNAIEDACRAVPR